MDESDVDFWIIYAWIPNEKLRNLVIEKSELLVSDENFSEDSLVLNIKYDSIDERIGDLENQRFKIEKELSDIFK